MPWSAYRDRLEYVGVVGILAIVYYGAAAFGLGLAYVHPSITTVWPPTGIAIVVLLLCGFRYAPGVFLGAFTANVANDGMILTSLGIALGNTLEALVGSYLIAQFAHGASLLSRANSIVSFVVSVGIAAAVSATIGVSVLSAQSASFENFGHLWITWWLGDVGGTLLIIPLVLAWWNEWTITWRPIQVLEVLGILVSTCALSYIVFGPVDFRLGVSVVPVLLWVVMRFSIREVSSTLVLLSACAILGTLYGYGPYTTPTIEEGLLYLQAFIIVTTISSLIVSAVVSERREVRKALEATDQRKDDFLTTLSHELRNPLASIMSHVQLVEYEQPSEYVAKLLRNVRLELSHTTRLLEDLLDLSRIRRGRMVLHKDTVDVCSLAQATCDSFLPIAQEAGHQLERRIPREPLWIHGDPSRVKQILMNLLSNACKYTEHGGTVVVSCTREGDKAVLSVEDTGPGMRQAHFHEILDAGNLSPQHPRAGLGVGLVLVKRLADMHDATFTLRHKTHGTGSIFDVAFPLAPQRELPFPTAKPRSLFAHTNPEQDAGISKRHVLVVDDNERAAEALVKLLEKLGHVGRATHDGESTLEFLKTERVDVVFLDILLPDMSGYALAERIRALPAPHPILVALSGYGSEEDVARSREIGIARHLIKPVDVEELQELLR